MGDSTCVTRPERARPRRQGVAGGEGGVRLLMGKGCLFGVMGCSGIKRGLLHNSVDTLTHTELYNLNGLIFWYMKYSSIK